MTITIISERIIRILSGGNAQRDNYHIADVEYLVRDTAAKLVKGEWFAERNEGGKVIDPRYIVTFPAITIELDDVTKENYIEMPIDTYLRLPYGAGVQSIRPDIAESGKTKDSELRAFIPIPNRFEDIYWQLPAGSLEGIYGYMIRRNRAVFTQRYGKTLLEYGFKTVSMDVVTLDPKAVGLDDALPISQEMQQQIITEVVTILKQGSPEVVDQINDENPNKLRPE